MKSPPTIAAYLVEFDAELQARLRRRRRIVAEIEDHLREAAAAGLKRGLGQAEAEAAAIACFGDPASVAEGFGADAVARVTTRLVAVGQSLDLWMAQHPWGGAALAGSVPAVVYLIGATVGVVFNRMPAYIIAASALEPFPLTFLMWGVLARSLRGRPEPGLSARANASGKQELFRYPYLWWLGVGALSLYHEMVGRRDVWVASFTPFLACQPLVAALSGWSEPCSGGAAGRGRAAMTGRTAIPGLTSSPDTPRP